MKGVVMPRPCKIGVFLPTGELQMNGVTPKWADLMAMAQRAEEIGCDSVWLPDHLIYRFTEIAQGAYDCMSLLAGFAAVTKRVELGTLVLSTSFRNPAYLAKMADTIDEMSGGRLILGIGAGYHEPEYRAFGFPYDHRASRFEEALTIIHTLLRTGAIDFAGRFYSARDCELRIRGPRPNGPPIMIGTTGERMLRLTAQYADMWNRYLVFGDSHATEIPPLRERVDAACAEVGRDPATLARTVTVLVDFINRPDAPPVWNRPQADPTPITGTPEEMAAQLRAFADEGISHIQIWTNPRTVAGVERLAPVLEALDKG
jgi:alkanesulfonate monooxygenase SsuD/methylene tetrahydromethanopterin reductase-like flavin-dependent oxidoreductase (luciferase family)